MNCNKHQLSTQSRIKG